MDYNESDIELLKKRIKEKEQAKAFKAAVIFVLFIVACSILMHLGE